jgi:hypothetical protein
MFITVGKSCDKLSSFTSGLINFFAHNWFNKHNFPTVITASALATGSLVTSLTPAQNIWLFITKELSEQVTQPVI